MTEPNDRHEGDGPPENGAADNGVDEAANGSTNGAPDGTGTPDQLQGAVAEAEAAINRKPEVDYLLVADRAEVVNGKLYLMGGSWDRIQPQQFPHRMMLGIALGVRIPFAHTDEQHTVAIEIMHNDERQVGWEAKLTTGRPPGMAGMDMLVPMAFNIPVAIPGEGTVVLKAAVDGREPRRHEIRAVQRQQQQGQIRRT